MTDLIADSDMGDDLKRTREPQEGEEDLPRARRRLEQEGPEAEWLKPKALLTAEQIRASLDAELEVMHSQVTKALKDGNIRKPRPPSTKTLTDVFPFFYHKPKRDAERKAALKEEARLASLCKEGSREASFESLPNEILMKIIGSATLSPKHALRTVGSINRRLRRLCFRESAWEGSSLLSFVAPEVISHIASRIARPLAIKSLRNPPTLLGTILNKIPHALYDNLLDNTLGPLVEDYFKAVIEVLRHTPSLECLELYQFGTLVPSALTETIRKLPIVTITISLPDEYVRGLLELRYDRSVRPSVSDVLLISQHCPNLVSLSATFDGSVPMGPDFAEQLHVNCPHLTALELICRPWADWRPVVNFYVLNLGPLKRSLRSLILQDVVLAPQHLDSLATLSLSYSFGQGLPKPYLFSFSGAGLIKFALKGVYHCKCTFQQCPSLTDVDIQGCDADGISAVMEECNSLVRIDLSSFNAEEGENYLSIRNCEKLQHVRTTSQISISGCPAVEHMDAETMSNAAELKGLAKLQHLSFSDVFEWNQKTLNTFGSQLTSLILTDNWSYNPSAPEVLNLPSLEHLRLTLSEYPPIIQIQCPNLAHLVLDVTDDEDNEEETSPILSLQLSECTQLKLLRISPTLYHMHLKQAIALVLSNPHLKDFHNIEDLKALLDPRDCSLFLRFCHDGLSAHEVLALILKDQCAKWDRRGVLSCLEDSPALLLEAIKKSEHDRLWRMVKALLPPRGEPLAITVEDASGASS
mmetsp:Transcript_3946/g.6051  ORF Transcript_3946/g.6051 Transcript_3946/m.6051 type:complete len:754 (-) Transcript_3946:971-3232(-)